MDNKDKEILIAAYKKLDGLWYELEAGMSKEENDIYSSVLADLDFLIQRESFRDDDDVCYEDMVQDF